QRDAVIETDCPGLTQRSSLLFTFNLRETFLALYNYELLMKQSASLEKSKLNICQRSKIPVQLFMLGLRWPAQVQPDAIPLEQWIIFLKYSICGKKQNKRIFPATKSFTT